MKHRQKPVFQRVGKLSTRWQTSKKEVRFFAFGFVGVRGYVKRQMRKKQVMELILPVNQLHFYFYLINYNSNTFHFFQYLLAVKRLFRQSVTSANAGVFLYLTNRHYGCLHITHFSFKMGDVRKYINGIIKL